MAAGLSCTAIPNRGPTNGLASARSPLRATATYAPGAKCTISLKFTPSMLAAETASLTVANNAANSPQTVALTGTGVLPVELSPTSLSFGNVYESVSRAAKTVTMTNYQKVTLTDIVVGTTSTDYTQTNTCGTSIAAGKKCTITVTFTPSKIGTDDATLSITDSASNSPQTAALTGTGLALVTPTLTLAASPNPATLGHAVKLTATLSPSGATGKVTFYDGTTVLEIGPLSASRAALTTKLLSSGTHSLKAYYWGDATHDASVSAAVTETVNALPQNGFQPAVSYVTGNTPTWVATGDFNRDGKTDLAATNYGDNTVSVLLGNGNGTFQAAVTYPVGTSPASVVAADVNGDGKPDLVVLNMGSNNVSVLLGNGDGTFQAAVNYPVGNSPFGSVGVGDFNGDGSVGLAVATDFDNTVSILLGNGDGTFRSGGTYGVPQHSHDVAVGDFNGDGKVDLAVPSTLYYYSNNYVSILLGNGDGTFQQAVNYGAPNPHNVVVGNFNLNGKLDLALPNWESPNSTSVLLGNGDGTFQGHVDYSTAAGGNLACIAVGDFNGDGTPDLAICNDNTSDISVLIGNGDGTFQQPSVTYVAGSNPSSIAVGDFNGDGVTDLAVAISGSNTISILLGVPHKK
jgi:hypothetical protein